MEDNTVFNSSSLAHYLLMNDDIDKIDMKSIMGIDIEKQNKNKVDQETFKFEIIINIAMEIIFQYLHLSSLANLLDDDGSVLDNINIEETDMKYNLQNYTVNQVEDLLKSILTKISILPIINKKNNSNNQYCRIIFKDLCNKNDSKYFEGIESKFHFVLNSRFDKTQIKCIDDVYALLTIKNEEYILKFIRYPFMDF